MAKIIFLGGVAGVGKSTLLSRSLEKLGSERSLVDPGELFRKNFYFEKRKTISEIEDLIVEEILDKAILSSTVIVHWHYAVRMSEGYIPQISLERLKRVAESGVVEEVSLVLIEAPTEVILERREKDAGVKTRPLSLEIINEEIVYERDYLKKEFDIFTRPLGVDRVKKIIIENTDLEMAEKEVLDIIL